MSSSKESQKVKPKPVIKDDVSNLKQLGSKETDYIYDLPHAGMLETFENKDQKTSYTIFLEFNEFTSLCPKTGQPDFAKIEIRYTPKKKCVETKSLKLYFFAYRNYGTFMETATNKIKDDLVQVLKPVFLSVHSKFKTRGGIVLSVDSHYDEEDEI